MVDANPAALQDAPHGFDLVGRSHSVDELRNGMAHNPVVRKGRAGIRPVLVRHQRGLLCDHCGKCPVDRIRPCIRNHLRGHPASPLLRPEDGDLPDRPPAKAELLRGVSALLPASEIGGVRLDDVLEQPVRVHGLRAGRTNALEHEPRRLLRHADVHGKLDRGDPLAGGDDPVEGVEPFRKGDMGALEDRPRADREDPSALRALVISAHAVALRLPGMGMSTEWADDAIGPADPGKVPTGLGLGREPPDELDIRNRRVLDRDERFPAFRVGVRHFSSPSRYKHPPEIQILHRGMENVVTSRRAGTLCVCGNRPCERAL